MPDATDTFVKKEEVSETRHLLGTAFGWGGLPVYEAFYIDQGELRKTGEYQLTVKDVPVDCLNRTIKYRPQKIQEMWHPLNLST